MAWFKKQRSPMVSVPKDKVRIPEDLWIKCEGCKEIIYRKEVERNLKVCPKCDYHFRLSSSERIALLLDDGRGKLFAEDVQPDDPLGFRDLRRYRDRVKEAASSTGTSEAIVVVTGEVEEIPVVLGVMEFSFMGGSMGSVVGERITRAIELAIDTRRPLILVSTSGGARMQEGVLSLMQMAKVSAALARLGEARLPYISVLSDPTFAGVTASYAMLGDLNIAEPGAMIGFTGPRVIAQTIRQELPAGFQRAEFLLQHGMLDMVVPRAELKSALARALGFLLNPRILTTLKPEIPDRIGSSAPSA
ncbi:MAG TPA: acetyl-CoA carboxylase, carboxyltransferase subunit beta [Acidobacteriota bacterium]